MISWETEKELGKSQRSLPIAIDRKEDLAFIGNAGLHTQDLGLACSPYTWKLPEAANRIFALQRLFFMRTYQQREFNKNFQERNSTP